MRSVTINNNGADGKLYLLDTAQLLEVRLGRGDSDARCIAQADRFTHEFGHHLVAMKARHEENSVHTIEHVKQKLMGQLEADLYSPLTRLFHINKVLMRDDDPGQLVVAELGVFVALQRHD